MSIKILIADDHKIVRDGLRSLLEKHDDMEVVAEAENGRTAVELARKLSTDVVVMDISMPDLNGIEATRQIISARPEVKVIALSMHSDRRFVIGMFQAGVSGFLLKDCAFEELASAILAVTANQKYLSPLAAGVMIEDYLQRLPPEDDSASSVLTRREREVLQLLAEGWSTKKIASHLHVSVKTVETHRRRIMAKLKVHSIAELTKYAIREGLTSLEL
jgi:DNA-binding NarL/FixJ family response regulator